MFNDDFLYQMDIVRVPDASLAAKRTTTIQFEDISLLLYSKKVQDVTQLTSELRTGRKLSSSQFLAFRKLFPDVSRTPLSHKTLTRFEIVRFKIQNVVYACGCDTYIYIYICIHI